MFGLFLTGKVAQMAQFASIFAYGTLADAVRIKPNPCKLVEKSHKTDKTAIIL